MRELRSVLDKKFILYNKIIILKIFSKIYYLDGVKQKFWNKRESTKRKDYALNATRPLIDVRKSENFISKIFLLQRCRNVFMAVIFESEARQYGSYQNLF